MGYFKKIFEPIHIRNLTLKNRLVVSAMVTQYLSEDGIANERFCTYHEEKAQGGWGLIITENYTIARGVGAYSELPGLYSDEQIASHKELVRRVHAAGAKIACQIYNAGRQINYEATGVYPVGPSAIPYGEGYLVPKILTTKDIQEIVKQFAYTAARVQAAGFDAVEIHGAHGYLLHSFVSPLSNKRTDKYGGDIIGRSRFSVEVVKAVRAAVGDDFPIFYRMSAAEYEEGGLDITEAQILAMQLEEAGVDLIHVSQGGTPRRINVVLPSSHETKAGFADNAAAIKQVVQIPVIAVGRINNPYLAEKILLAQQADMVTMAKSSLADPQLPLKTMQNQYEDIRLCIGCMQGCTRGCTVNPRLGHEKEYPQVMASMSKKVFVVGGGVAGCAAAIAARERGHEVTLYEKDNQLGGQWRLACVPPGKTDFATYVIWQEQRLQRLGVNVLLNTVLTKEIVQREMPEAIILAAGSIPLIPPIPGIEQKNVTTAHEILKGKVIVKGRIAIIGGGLVGAETAEYLSQFALSVTVIEMTTQIARDASPRVRLPLLERLKKRDVTLITDTKVTKIEDDKVYAENTTGEMILSNIDTIILALGVQSRNCQFDFLQSYNGKVVKCGDISNPKDGKHNIQEGFAAGYHI